MADPDRDGKPHPRLVVSRPGIVRLARLQETPRNRRPGWDNKVLEEMRENIGQKLRDFWDAGIHGPDFVWAATGPALEAYSKHPIVKKANAPARR